MGVIMVKEMIGERIKQYRISKKCMNQEEFANELGWDKTYLSRVETGKQNITIDNLVLVCETLNITLKDFFDVFDRMDFNGEGGINDA